MRLNGCIFHNSRPTYINFSMKNPVKSRLFLWKRDLFTACRRNRNSILAWSLVLLFGVGLGIYIGLTVGEKESPFGVFAALFNLEFAPFDYLVPDLLRFLAFSILSMLALFLPLPVLYPTLSLFLFGKHFGEIACVCFLSDGLPAALLSLFVIYLPLLLFGGSLLIFVAHRAKLSRLRYGGSWCQKAIKREILFWLKVHFAYFLVLLLLYVIVCGILYLFVIAL